jgi:NAD(P)-dependent dehydrogenase (short-subunit alcohol dehydrogenase family)
MTGSDGDATTLESFPGGLRALVFGASGGLGGAFAALLAGHPRVGHLHVAAREPEAVLAAVAARAGTRHGVSASRFDLLDERSIESTAAAAAAAGPLHLVIVATGVLHDGPGLQPEKSWRSLNADSLARAFALNATGPALIARHTLGRLACGEKAAFAALSARVGSIEDNRLGGWHAYRASKAALHMLVRSFSIELRQRNPGALCVALHPGTVDTGMSKPFQSGVAPGRLFTPEYSARRMLGVLDRLGAADSGRPWAWDGQPIPF